MKAVLLIALTTLVAGVARADWKDIKPGMDARTAWNCAGVPIIRSKGPAAEMWTYDNGGYILLSGSRVTYWEAPKAPAKPAFIAKAVPISPVRLIPGHVPGKAVALKD